MLSPLNSYVFITSNQFLKFLLIIGQRLLTQPFLDLVIGSYDQIRIARIKRPLQLIKTLIKESRSLMKIPLKHLIKLILMPL